MRKPENKTKISTITLILVLTISAILVALPVATAQSTMKSYPYIGAVPNPVGVNQQVLLHVGITLALSNVAQSWEDLTVTVTRPNDTTETLTDISTDSTGGTGRVYTPTMVGTYYLQTHFPEQVTTDTKKGRRVSVGTTMLAGDSVILELVVQEESIAYYPGVPLPTEYWTRPIDAQAREWSTIASSWLYVPRNKFTPYNDGPETAHILWVEPLTIGGIVGGALGTPDLEALGYHGFECGDAYEGKWGGRVRGWGAAGPIIIAGRLYYRGGAHALPRLYHCVDLHTGEELWAKTFLDNRSISFGQLFYWDSPNFHGTFAYLWVNVGSTWNSFDAFTGEWMFTVENVPSGTTRWGPKGDIFRFNVDLRNGRLTMWNLTASCLNQGASGYGINSWGNSVHLKTFDAAANTTEAQSAWSLNVTIPTDLTGRVREIYFEDRLISVSASTTEVSSWGLSLKPGQEGQLLFDNTWNAPAEWAAGNVSISVVIYSPYGEDGVFVVFARELREYYGFSMNTGEYLWGPTEPEHYLNTFVGTECTIAYGVFISSGVSGITTAYNATTGALLWEYHAVDPYQEILWANSWWTKPIIVTDGKIYLSHMEHSSIDPKPRGAPFICLDMITGEEIWRANGLFRQTYWGSNAIIGDSIIATMDVYDQRVYAIGKGPSAITAEAPLLASTLGSTVTIRGRVADISPGTQEYAIAARFPNGVPAVADESMSDWMLYVYKQFARPADATGVTVTLETIDPNYNYQYLGTATTDTSGNYGFTFEPEVPGQYMILATFYGSNGYYASTTTTYLSVDPAPSPAQQIEPEPAAPEPTEPEATEPLATQPDPNEPEPTESTTAPIITTEQIIIAAVAISVVIGAVSFLTLRKQQK